MSQILALIVAIVATLSTKGVSSEETLVGTWHYVAAHDATDVGKFTITGESGALLYTHYDDDEPSEVIPPLSVVARGRIPP